MTTDTFLFNAGWLFFAVWIAVITSVTIAAFGRELLPLETNSDAANKSKVQRSLRFSARVQQVGALLRRIAFEADSENAVTHPLHLLLLARTAFHDASNHSCHGFSSKMVGGRRRKRQRDIGKLIVRSTRDFYRQDRR
jgi:hypothetical protein